MGGEWSYSSTHSYLTTVLELDGDEQPATHRMLCSGVHSDEAPCSLQRIRTLSIKEKHHLPRNLSPAPRLFGPSYIRYTSYFKNKEERVTFIYK
jgi:hypothetical protein